MLSRINGGLAVTPAAVHHLYVHSIPDRLVTSLAPRYRLERELGRGGMATVYLAQDLKHDRPVAIKVLHEDLGATLGSDRFLAEIRTTARLQRPHILPLLDSGAARGGGTDLARGFTLALNGDADAARSTLTPEVERWAWSDFEYSMHVAHMLATNGDVDESIRWLTRSVDLGYINYPFLANHDRIFDPMRRRGKFVRLMDRVRLEWETAEATPT